MSDIILNLSLINILYSAIIWLIAFALFTNHPVNTLITLISIIILSTIIISTQDFVFIAYIYLLVYLGAITILFLFVLMLFNLTKLITTKFIKRLDPFILELIIIFIIIYSILVLLRIEFLRFNNTVIYWPINLTVLTTEEITRIATFTKWNLTGLYQDPINIKIIDPIMNIDILTLCALILLVSMIGAMILVLGISEAKLKLNKFKDIIFKWKNYNKDLYILKNKKLIEKKNILIKKNINKK